MDFLTTAFNKEIEFKFPNIKFTDISQFTKIDEIVNENDTSLQNDFFFQESLDKLKSPYFLVTIFSDGKSKAFLPKSNLPHKLSLDEVYNRIISEEDIIEINSFTREDINQIVNIAKTDVITFKSSLELGHLEAVLYDNTRFVVVCKENNIYTACRECSTRTSTIDSRNGCEVKLDLLDKKITGGDKPQTVDKDYVDAEDIKVQTTVTKYIDDNLKKLSDNFDDKLNNYGVKTIQVMKDDITDINSQIKQLGTTESTEETFIKNLQDKIAELDKEIASVSSHTQTKGVATEAELKALQDHLNQQLSESVAVLNSNIATNNQINFIRAELTPNGNGIRLTRNNGQFTDVSLTENIAQEKTILTLSKQYTDVSKADLERQIAESNIEKTNYVEFTDQAEFDKLINISDKYKYIFLQDGGDEIVNIKFPLGSLEGSFLFVHVSSGKTLNINSKNPEVETFDGGKADVVLDSNTFSAFLLEEYTGTNNWLKLFTIDESPLNNTVTIVDKFSQKLYNVNAIEFGEGLTVFGVDDNKARIGISPGFLQETKSESFFATTTKNINVKRTSHILLNDNVANDSAGISIDKSLKQYNIEESISKDPNLEQSHAFISLQLSIQGNLDRQDIVTVSLVDKNGAVLQMKNIDNDTVNASVSISNQIGSEIRPIVVDIEGIFEVKGSLTFSINVNIESDSPDFGIRILDYFTGSNIFIQNLDDGTLTNAIFNNYRILNNVDYLFEAVQLTELYDYLGAFAGADPIVNVELSKNTVSTDENNIMINTASSDIVYSADSTGLEIKIKPNSPDLFFASVGYVELQQDTILALHNKKVSMLGSITDRYSALAVYILQYTGANDWDVTKPIITGWGNPDNQGVRILFAEGWSVLAKQFLSEDVSNTPEKFDIQANVPSTTKGLAFLFVPDSPYSVGDNTGYKVLDFIIQPIGQQREWVYRKDTL